MRDPRLANQTARMPQPQATDAPGMVRPQMTPGGSARMPGGMPQATDAPPQRPWDSLPTVGEVPPGMRQFMPGGNGLPPNSAGWGPQEWADFLAVQQFKDQWMQMQRQPPGLMSTGRGMGPMDAQYGQSRGAMGSSTSRPAQMPDTSYLEMLQKMFGG